MSREWVAEQDSARIAGPVIASSRGAATSLLRQELGRKRLPKGSTVVELNGRKPRQTYEAPYSISRIVHYHHNAESLDCMDEQDREGARDACDKTETFLVLDHRGRVVCGRDTIEEANKKITALKETT